MGKKVVINIWLLCLLLFLFINASYAAQRIFYEDCEDTNFTEYFLERNYGTTYAIYWDTMKTALTRSNLAPHSGSFSMTYDPFTVGNPHAVIGFGDRPYGNTSNFRLRDHAGRYWYFRWYQRWETGIDWGGYMVKMLYVNYQDTRDFTYFIVKSSSTGLLSTLKDYNTYSLINNRYKSMPATDDMQWHKMELLLDVGTTGASNGSILFKVDDTVCVNESGLTYNGTITNNPIGHITGWPSNLSGDGGSGTARTWLDDLEIYTLDGPNDIPPELGGGPVDNPPTVIITTPSSTTYSTSSSTFDLSGTSTDDNGVTSISWSNNRGGSGTVVNDSGDWSSWSVSGITIVGGDNVITVTTQDTDGQSSSDVVTVTYISIPQDFRRVN